MSAGRLAKGPTLKALTWTALMLALTESGD